MKIEFNINDWVEVKLTRYGRDIQDAIGTEKEGQDLVEVVRNACCKEEKIKPTKQVPTLSYREKHNQIMKNIMKNKFRNGRNLCHNI